MAKKQRKGLVLAIANNKGGCGKTCTAQNLAAALRLSGRDVLAVDLDGQANLTLCFAQTPGAQLYNAMKGTGGTLEPVAVLPSEGNAGALDLLPACQDLAALGVEIAGRTDRAARLGAVLEPLRAKYDFVIIDTPPAADLLAINAIGAADAVIVPTDPQPLSVQGLVKTREHLAILEQLTGKARPFSVLFTRFDRRKSLHRLTAEAVKGAGVEVLPVAVRECVAFGESNAAALDVFRYAPKSNGAQDYTAAAAAVLAWVSNKF